MRKPTVALAALLSLAFTAAGSGTPPARVPFAIIGLSHDHAGGFIPHIREHQDVELVGIVEPKPDLVSAYARRFQLPANLFYASLGELLARTNVQAVATFTSTFEHRRVVEECAARGIHVMMEKPLAVTQQIKPEVYPNVEDEATIVLTYPKAQGIIQASWNWPFDRKDLEVYGQTGYVLVPRSDRLRVRKPNAGENETRAPALSSPLTDPLSYLAAVVRGDLRPDGLSSLAVNLIVTEILDAARESARTGKRIDLH
jgi:predicted dehydrogenase